MVTTSTDPTNSSSTEKLKFEESLKIKIEESSSLVTNESQDPLTSRSRLRALCVMRWEYLMDIRERIGSCGQPPPDLDADIVRAYDADAWPEIDTRIGCHVEFSLLNLDVQSRPEERMRTWRCVTTALYDPKTREVCEECVEEFRKLASMRDRMTALKMDITAMDREMERCFEPLPQLQILVPDEKHPNPAPAFARPLANSTKSVNKLLDDVNFKVESIKAYGIPTEDSVSKKQPELATTTTVDNSKPCSTPSTEATSYKAATSSSKHGVASIVEILDDDTTEIDQSMPVTLPSPATYFNSNKKDSIVHALNQILASVKRGGPGDATQDISEESDNPVSNRKRRKRNTSVADYQRCSTPFTFSLNAVGDGFLHIQPLPLAKRDLKMVFDVQTQHLTITHLGESLSAVWSNLKVPAIGVYEVERAALHVHVDRFVRIHYLDHAGKQRILEAQMTDKEDCKSLIQKLQNMTKCKESSGNIKPGQDKVFKSESATYLPDMVNLKELSVRQIEVEAAGLKIFWNFRNAHTEVKSGKMEKRKKKVETQKRSSQAQTKFPSTPWPLGLAGRRA